MITFPYRLALHFHRADDTAADPWPHLPGIERAIDVFFVTDVLLNFRTTYVSNKDGVVERRPLKCAKHYLCGWFFLDLCSSVPMDLIVTQQGGDGGGATELNTLRWIKVLKLGKLLRFTKELREHRLTTTFTRIATKLDLGQAGQEYRSPNARAFEIFVFSTFY